MVLTRSSVTKSRLLVPATILAFTLGPWVFRRHMRRVRKDHESRWTLWNHFYAMNWGDTTTNNYGYAPADGADPQRFQHQLYRELVKLMDGKAPQRRPLRLLEVSCGRGGGLMSVIEAAPDRFDATGLDVAASAIAHCSRGQTDRLRFVEGSALDLPFPDGSFDVLLNVEASNDYGDRLRFFKEAARVLTGDGIFLYAESLKSEGVDRAQSELEAAGFRATFRDITGNVLEACRLDSARRRNMIRHRAPFLFRLVFTRQLENYAGVEGTSKYRAFADGRRTYIMTAATKE
jgi:ubiquinone/menaquinone biosynthesis C-methylase UbiE